MLPIDVHKTLLLLKKSFNKTLNLYFSIFKSIKAQEKFSNH